MNAANVTIDGGLTLQNSPFWTVHLVYSEDILIDGVHIRAPRNSPNTDGVDVDSTQRVHIVRCVIDVGDDAVAVKSGLNQWGRAVNISSANVLIEHNRIWGKAIAVGSEMSGGVFNVTARHNLMGDSKGAVTGLLIKSAQGRGASVRNITFTDNHLLNVSRVYSWIPALVVSDHYGGGPPGNATTTPILEDIRFVNILVDFAEQTGCLQGLPSAHLRGIVMANVTFKEFHTGWSCQNCDSCGAAFCDQAAGNTTCGFGSV
jgi:polygalacturonase